MILFLLACSESSAPPAPEPDAPASVESPDAPASVEAPAPVEAPSPDESAPPRIGSIGGAPILDEPVVLGKLARAAIDEPISAVRPAVHACWEAVAAERPRGKVLVKLSVSPDGEVRRSRVMSTSLRHPEAEACMLAAAEKARFPAFEGTEVALVTTPFVFP